MFGHRYYGARYFWPRYFGPSAGVTVGRRKRRFHVKREDMLYFFDTLAEAERFIRQTERPPELKKKKRKQFKLVKPAETYSIPELVEKAPEHMQEQIQRWIAQAQYALLIQRLEELAEEDDIEVMLLAL